MGLGDFGSLDPKKLSVPQVLNLCKDHQDTSQDVISAGLEPTDYNGWHFPCSHTYKNKIRKRERIRKTSGSTKCRHLSERMPF